MITVLGPILRAEKFVLVGDYYQLPPLVISPEAQRKGMDVSLLKR
jgi:DNA replication ATP-dependent helicase Dna2